MGKTVNVGDIDLYYEFHGSGEPVLFVHGLGADRQSWMFQVKQMSDRHQLIVFDNRDAGKSSRSPKNYDIRQLADDTLGLIEALKLKRFHLVGSSMGGAIAQVVALSAPEKLASLSLLGTYHSVDPSMRSAFDAWADIYRAVTREQFFRAWFPLIYNRKFWVENPETIEELMQFTIDNPDAPDADALDRQTKAAVSHNATDLLKEINIPTQVLCGQADMLTPSNISNEIATAIPDAHLKSYPDTGHAFFIEKATEVCADLGGFFSKHPVGSSS